MNEDRLKLIMDRLPVGIVQIAADCRILFVNATACRMLGRGKESLTGVHYAELLHASGNDQDAARIITETLHDDKDSPESQAVFRTENQRPILVTCTSRVLESESGRTVLLVFRDRAKQSETEDKLKDAIQEQLRTELRLRETLNELQILHDQLKNAQDQLIQSEKMRSVGQLAAGVAHEVKNPLAILLQGMEYLEKFVPQERAELKGVIEDMTDAVRRADSVIKQLLDFASPAETEKSEEDIHAAIDRSLNLVRHMIIANGVKVEKKFDASVVPVRIDRNGIEQLLINLLSNAVNAMPEGGKLSVRTEFTYKEGTDWIVIYIEDTGTGIPPEIIRRIFEPFVTTRRGKGGTGLGLAVARSIAEKHGGDIRIENRAEGGAIATVFINAANK